MSETTITAAEANRNFSRLLRGVREGESYVVTAHGQPVARIVPASAKEDRERLARRSAFRALMERVRSQPAMNAGPWTRDELYEK